MNPANASFTGVKNMPVQVPIINVSNLSVEDEKANTAAVTHLTINDITTSERTSVVNYLDVHKTYATAAYLPGTSYYDGSNTYVFFSNESAAPIRPGALVGYNNLAIIGQQVAALSAVGSKTVTVTVVAGAAQDLFTNGYFAVDTTTNPTGTYKIKSNTAAIAAADTIITLYDPLNEAIAAANTATIQPNGYIHGEVLDIAANDTPLGVTVSRLEAVAAGALSFGWVQPGGIGTFTTDTAVSIARGSAVIPAGSVGRVVARAATDTAGTLGTSLVNTAAVTGTPFLVNLSFGV